ncbi:hypothetical protein AAFC00_004108 [Neodothiora populina]|uniref:Kinetochore protein Sos7 coiled-coil domain-containing protein n=1 Tax=Neodothiora populina TaxID=2781224 RepID=A0ABR3PIJ5_9PEZI
MPSQAVVLEDALATLNTPADLSILSLAEPILSSSSSTSVSKAARAPLSATSSSNSAETENNDEQKLTPASLDAELAHYKDLFAKLRFSYVEQVTKERFLKAIVADPPELVTAAQNDELEEELKEAKATLKRKKVAMEDMIAELGDMARRLAQTYEIVQLQSTQLATLPDEIEYLDAHIASLRAAQEPASTDPEMNLSLPATQALLSEREAELAELDRELAELRSALPRKQREVKRLEAGLGPLEEKKRKIVDEAKEAKRQRGVDGAMARELEERGRWLKGVHAGLTAMLQV